MMGRRFFNWYFATPEEPRPWFKVIWWWEVRRIPYNLVVGLVGFISLLLFFLFITLAHELKPGEDAVEPLALMAAPFAINIAYTAGWMAELLLRIVWRERSAIVGPAFLRLGLSFSLVVVLLPAILWCIIGLVRSIGAV